jgi:hypothetical protein
LFQLLVWSVRSLRGLFCTYEKTAEAAEYSEIVGLEEVEMFLPLTRLPISECKKIEALRFNAKRLRRFASMQKMEALRFNAKDNRSPASVPSDLWIR